MSSAVSNIRSIQGELFDKQGTTWMDMDEVDKYVDSVSDDVLACRERMRHMYPSIRKAGIVFTDVTDDGLLVREVKCECCQLAVRVEFWEARTVGSGKKRETRYGMVAAHTTYSVGPNGERYLGPAGHGRMTSRMVRESVATQALAGQSLALVKKAASKRGGSK